MRISTFSILALSAVASAQDQFPLFEKAKSWFDQASAYVKSTAASGRAAAASNIAEHAVTPITWDNWRSVLRHTGARKPSNAPEPWLIYTTGGNKTCHGRCGKADEAWNEAVTYFVTDPSAPKLGLLDCESQALLCGAWATNVPSLWFFLVPKDPQEKTEINIFRANITSVTADDITRIHTRKLYMNIPNYEGALHPFDGWVAQYGLLEPVAYFLFYISKIPNWSFMIFVSLFSRWFVNKRMPRPNQEAGSAGARAPAAGSS